jgi:hypothetical protein
LIFEFAKLVKIQATDKFGCRLNFCLPIEFVPLVHSSACAVKRRRLSLGFYHQTTLFALIGVCTYFTQIVPLVHSTIWTVKRTWSSFALQNSSAFFTLIILHIFTNYLKIPALSTSRVSCPIFETVLALLFVST